MRILTLALLLLSAPVVANDVKCDETPPTQSGLAPVIAVAQMATSSQCPNASRLRHICMSIDDRVEDPQPLAAHYKYEYERMILEAACVSIQADTEAVQNRKVQQMWRQLEGRLTCSGTSFEVQNGSLIKFAINSLFDDFIENIQNWGVNLNKVDDSDGKTPLDYLRDKISRSRGSPNERHFKSYYDQLRASGAKHRSEL